jgi:hypothetical protein
MASRIVVLKEISDRIYHLEFPGDGYLMCSSLIRFQEHYESPRFKGKIFTLAEYMDYYALKFGNFTYFQDIAGFNMPSSTFRKFYDGKFDPLTNKEKKILEVFRNMRALHIEKPYYIIATCARSTSHENDLIHELSHGLYYVNDDYRKQVRALLRGRDFEPLRAYLKERGYHKQHFTDEIQALLLEDAESFSRTEARASDYLEIRRVMRKIYDTHFVRLISKSQKVRLPQG